MYEQAPILTTEAEPQIPEPSTIEWLTAQREHFTEQLVEKGMISQEYASSGALDSFGMNEQSCSDALVHVLVGDGRGGGHHLRTMVEMGNNTAASVIQTRDNRPYNKLKAEQSVRPSGVFRARYVQLNGNRKQGISAMFPNEWSTEDVLRAIVGTAYTPPLEHDFERSSYVHISEVNGVRVRVVTDEKSGKIITAAPKVASK
jgi:hypothetical protein